MSNRIIKVFLSSTFRDMNVERDYLNKIIFPQIRNYCDKRFLQFHPIDLRWGITEEASRNGLVLSTCMEEVDNSRPFFIGILGSRYGWQPTIKELGNLRASVQKEKSWLEQKVSDGASITEMEIEYGVLRNMDIPHASFLIRGENISIPNDFREKKGSEAERLLEKLKSRIRGQKKYPVTEYNSIEQFGEIIKHQIIEMIEAEYPFSRCEADDAILQRQEQIMEQRSHVLCDMNTYWSSFQEWFSDVSKQVLMICGAAGSGTSTILAYFCLQMKKHYKNKIVYFDLESAHGETKPLDAFFLFLDIEQNIMPTAEWSMIAIDNASMLCEDDVDRILSWLHGLNRNVHVVIATEQNSVLRLSLSFALGCPVMEVGQFQKAQKRQIIINYVRQYGKQLTEQQVDVLVNFDSINATILVLLLRSLVNYGSFDDLNNYINKLTKKTFSQYFLWEIQKESYDAFAAVDKLLGNKYMAVLTAIASAGTGISEKDLVEALDMSQAEWSVLRPNVLQFCKGNEDNLKLSNDNWYPNVGYEDWENVSRHLIKWYTAHPEKWKYAAHAMRHIFYFMIIPPFYDQGFMFVQADRRFVKDVLEELFAFVMSPDMVNQLNDMEYSSLWTRVPLSTKKMSDTPTIVYGRAISELSSDEKIRFYKRLANIADSLSRSVDAAWCYQQIGNVLARDNASEALVYKAKSLLIVGEAKRATDLLLSSDFIYKPKKSFFLKMKLDVILSYYMVCNMHQLLDSYCACGDWRKAKNILQVLCENIENCFAPKWKDSINNNALFNANIELIAKIAYIKSGYYPKLKDENVAWRLLHILNNNAPQLSVGNRLSCLRSMAHLALIYKSINSNLSETDRKQLYSVGWWAQVSANICYGANSYQLARTHLLFTYIHFKCYHNYGILARRLHDYVKRDRLGNALNHTDEYFYGALNYERSLENNVKRDIDWTKVDKKVQKQLLDEFDFYWNIEKEIQPDWYKPKLIEKRDAYRVKIHLLDKMPINAKVNRKPQPNAFHSYEKTQHDFASARLGRTNQDENE